MKGFTEISWTHFTFNPWWGCVKVGPACKNCYADAFSHRLGKVIWGPGTPRHFQKPTYYRNPQKWQKKAAKQGVAYRVFCASMGDIFEVHTNRGINARMNRFRHWLWAEIERTPNLVWMLLTKRPENMWDLAPKRWKARRSILAPQKIVSFPENVWIGTSIGTPGQVHRLDHMSLHNAGAKFISFEPLVERIRPDDFIFLDIFGKDWTFIAGGESGGGARPSELDWFRDIKEAARMTGSHFFMKQVGSKLAKQMGMKHAKGGDFLELPEDLQRRMLPDYKYKWGSK